ncbi:MAG: Na/Pi symporter [Bacteroidota bacterium]|nr:Na/Pi symporter [Bacteroidota bacterium]
MMETKVDIWPVLAGLGLFLFGIYMLEEALKNLIGRSFKIFLRKHTNNPIKAVLSGTLSTAVLQSSSMVLLLVMSFTGTGIIGLKNGIGMILGANLGTTITGWMVSLIGFKLNIGSLILPLIAIGGLGIIFLKSERLSHISKLLMGFSFMFMGLDFMKQGFQEFSQNIDLTFLGDKNPLFFVLFGILISASIQSSSAAMMIILSSLSVGIISLQHSFYLVIGSDLGTTITGIIASINGNAIKKKIGTAQFMFNFINAFITLIFSGLYYKFIVDIANISDPLIALVVFHSLFNLMGIIMFLPFLNHFTNMINWLIKHKETKLAVYISMANPREFNASIHALENESLAFFKKAIEVNQLFFNIKENSHTKALSAYKNLKLYEVEIVEFHLKLQENEININEAKILNSLIACIRNATLAAKDIKDIKHNLDTLNNSANDLFYHFFKTIQKNQTQFYLELIELIENIKFSNFSDLDHLKDINLINYQEEMDYIIKNLNDKNDKELNISSIFNMMRDVNNSNESAIRSLTQLLNRDIIKQVY